MIDCEGFELDGGIGDYFDELAFDIEKRYCRWQIY
jgi:hypothetical protein